MSLFIFFQKNNTNGGDLKWELELLLISNVISTFCLTFLIFVDWKKGPERWLKHSFKLFYVFVLLIYVILPLSNLLIFLGYICSDIPLVDYPVTSYIVFTAIVCLSRLFEFFTLIRRSILLDAKIFREM